MYDENCDLEVCYDNDNELEESFEDDEIETVESVDFQLIDSPEVQNEESNDIILDYEDSKDDELIISMSNCNSIDAMKAMIAIKNFLKKDMQPALLCFLDAEKVIIESIEARKKQTKITSYFRKL
jgi:hypothetical protein